MMVGEEDIEDGVVVGGAGGGKGTGGAATMGGIPTGNLSSRQLNHRRGSSSTRNTPPNHPTDEAAAPPPLNSPAALTHRVKKTKSPANREVQTAAEEEVSVSPSEAQPTADLSILS